MGVVEMSDLYQNRTFQKLDSDISGKSVVFERNYELEGSRGITPQEIWPYSLTDYLQKYIGKIIQIEYVLPNGRYSAKKGEIKVTGTNFIGIQPIQTKDLFLVDLNSIISINIVNYKNPVNRQNNRNY